LPAFSARRFKSPDSHWWPAYFWLWNDSLDPEVLIEQLHDMFLHDARSVCPVPMPPEFPYLSEGFFQRVRLVVEEAARLGMSYWLYDEGGWPSGNACGRVLQLRPDLVAKVMRLENGAWVPSEVPRFASLEEAGTRLRHPDTDLLDPETALTFIETTYAAYERAVGEHFARTIMFAFTDEPAFRPVKPGEEVPWTRGLEEDFRRSFGYSILDRLNAFSHSSSRLSSRDKEARIDFFDWVSRRFRASFLDTLRDWCRRRGLVLTGHLGGEHEALGALEHGFGNVLLALGGMDAPGIDVISRQIFPGKENPEFVKYASSIAHQKGSTDAAADEVDRRLPVCPRGDHLGDLILSPLHTRSLHARDTSHPRPSESPLEVYATSPQVHSSPRLRPLPLTMRPPTCLACLRSGNRSTPKEMNRR